MNSSKKKNVRAKPKVVLPDTLKTTGDVIIEIEEIIETVVSRRPVVNAAAGFAVEVIEKYERSAKMTLDDESQNRKQTRNGFGSAFPFTLSWFPISPRKLMF